MYKALTLFINCIFFINILNAQIQKEDQSLSSSKAQKTERKKDKIPVNRPYGYLGIGVGLDFGGIGIRTEFPVVNFLSVFGGGGYNLAGIGVNGGLLFKLLPEKNIRPIASCMYGYNAVIKEKTTTYYGRTEEKKTIYYGITAGAGFEIDFGEKKTNKFGLMLLVPFRSSAFYKDAELRKTSLPPVGVSLGVHFGM